MAGHDSARPTGARWRKRLWSGTGGSVPEVLPEPDPLDLRSPLGISSSCIMLGPPDPSNIEPGTSCVRASAAVVAPLRGPLDWESRLLRALGAKTVDLEDDEWFRLGRDTCDKGARYVCKCVGLELHGADVARHSLRDPRCHELPGLEAIGSVGLLALARIHVMVNDAGVDLSAHPIYPEIGGDTLVDRARSYRLDVQRWMLAVLRLHGEGMSASLIGETVQPATDALWAETRALFELGSRMRVCGDQKAKGIDPGIYPR